MILKWNSGTSIGANDVLECLYIVMKTMEKVHNNDKFACSWYNAESHLTVQSFTYRHLF